MKKLLACILALVLLLGNGTVAFAAVDSPAAAPEIVRPTLQFNENGRFTILFAADLQHWGDELSHASRQFLHALIQNNHRPDIGEPLDLIVLGGDNIEEPGLPGARTNYYTMIRSYMDIFAYHNIPVALVFGNHDHEAGNHDHSAFGIPGGYGRYAKYRQLDLYNTYANALIMCEDPEYAALFGSPTVWTYRSGNSDHPRFGGYHLPIASSDGSNAQAFNLWFFDTGLPDEGVSEASMQWYYWRSEQLRIANGGELVPSIAFQHIPVPRIGTVPVAHSSATGNTPTFEANYRGSVGVPNLPNYVDQYARMEARGDVLGMFFGHYHANHFIGYPAGGGIRLSNSSAVRVHDQDDARFYSVGRIITICEQTLDFRTHTNLVGGTGDNRVPIGGTEPQIIWPRAGANNLSFGHLYYMATSLGEGHWTHDLEFDDIRASTCSVPGLRHVRCLDPNCGYEETQLLKQLPHIDTTGNGRCDECNAWINTCCELHHFRNSFLGRVACFFSRAWQFVLRYVFFGWVWM